MRPTWTPRWPSRRRSRRASAGSRSGRSRPSTDLGPPMTAVDALPDGSAVAAAVADAHRREWAFVLAATVRVTRDLDVAEECAQEAFATALTDWRASGVPARPGAWLTTAAKRRALNALDRKSTRLN